MTAALRALAGAAAALTIGVLAGVTARVLMRLVAVVAGGETGFSLSGSLAIVALFVVAMLPGAVALGLGRRRTGAVLLWTGAALLLFQSAVIPLQEDRAALFGAGTVTTVLAVVLLLSFPALVLAQTVATARAARLLAARLVPAAPRAEATVGASR